ncbi:MAG: hypothetical protein F6K31_21600 [Symploca sp. SIO2G7]|nr:hypothetical protein [Symploca sp. SIO2G7]
MDSPSSQPSQQECAVNNVKRLIELGDKDQYNGNYQGATGNYLQALEFLYQILDDAQTLRDKNSLTSLRATILSKLGDNLIYVGQYKIAVEFYSQQLRIVNNFVNKLDIAFAYHKFGFCHYFMGLYESSMESQKKALDILATEEEKLEFKQIKCKINLCLGLNQYALQSYEEAANLYQEALDIARRYGLQYEEAEIIANLSSSVRKKLSLESSKLNLSSLENLISNLYYTIRISDNNPYIKSLASRELAKTYQVIDIDISFAKKYFEDALNIAKKYKFPFLSEIQSELNQIIQQEQEILEPDYILEEQPWYSSVFPKIDEIEPGKLESSSFKADFVIVTATPIELKAVVRLLDSDVDQGLLPCRVYTSSGQYYLGKFGYYKTVVTQCRMGTRDERSAGFVTQKALEIWKPKAVVMVGIAFGKSSIEQKIGDVLVATEIIDYDVNRIGLDGITDRGSRPPSNRSLLGLFEQAYEWEFYRPDGSPCNLIPAQFSILNSQFSILNSQFSILNSQFSILNSQLQQYCCC